MREKHRSGNTVTNCLSFRKNLTANRKDCLIMFHMFIGSIPMFLRKLFENYVVHLYIYIYHFRDTKPMRVQLHFRKMLWKNCMQNIQQVFFMTLFQNFQVWARCVIFAHKHQRFDVGASAFPRISMVQWKSCCHLQKHKHVSSSTTIVKRCLKNVLHCEKSASECLRHTASLYVFFAPTIHVGPLHGLTYQDQGFATASSLPPFSQLNMKQPGFTNGPNTNHNYRREFRSQTFRQYGQMKSRGWEEAERREE